MTEREKLLGWATSAQKTAAVSTPVATAKATTSKKKSDASTAFPAAKMAQMMTDVVKTQSQQVANQVQRISAQAAEQDRADKRLKTPTAITHQERQQLKEYNYTKVDDVALPSAKGAGGAITPTAINYYERHPELTSEKAQTVQFAAALRSRANDTAKGLEANLAELKAKRSFAETEIDWGAGENNPTVAWFRRTYGSKELLDEKIANTEMALFSAKYGHLPLMPDFEEKSKPIAGEENRFYLYGAVNGDKRSQENMKTWQGYTYGDVPADVAAVFNYLYATDGKDAAKAYIDAVQDREYTTSEAVMTGAAKGTGLIGLVDLLSGGKTAEENERRVAGAQQDHPFAFGVGNVGGSVGSMLATGKLASMLPGVRAMDAVNKGAATSAIAMGGNAALQYASPLAAKKIDLLDYMRSVAGSAAGGAVGGVAASGATALGTKALFKTGLEHNIFANAVNQGLGGAAFSAANAGTRAVIDPNYTPTGEELAKDAAVSFAFQTISSAIRLSGQTKQAQAALDREAALLRQDFDTLAKLRKAGIITNTDLLDAIEARSTTLRNTLNTTQYIGKGKEVTAALAYLDQLDDAVAEWRTANYATMLPGGFTPPAGASAGGVSTAPSVGGVPVPDWVTLPSGAGALATSPSVAAGSATEAPHGMGIGMAPPALAGAENGQKTAIAEGGAQSDVSPLLKPMLEAQHPQGVRPIRMEAELPTAGQKTASAGETPKPGLYNGGDVLYNGSNEKTTTEGGAHSGEQGTQLDGVAGEGIQGHLWSPDRRSEAGRALGQGDLSAAGELRLSDDKTGYSRLLNEAREADPENGWAVTPKSTDELADCRVFLSEDGGVGLAIAPDGDIQAVFRNKSKHPRKGAMKVALPQAIAEGGTKLDCYGVGLVRIYTNSGFVPVARVSFDPELANPGWTADKGTPDIFVMMATDTDADTVRAKQDSYHIWTDAELAALPLMEYDEAMAYRDRLLAERGITPGGVENPNGRGVGAAERGFTVPGGPSQEIRTSQYLDSMGYNQNQGEATGLEREPYERRFQYRVQSEGESSQGAYEMLFYQQGDGQIAFIKDIDPAGYDQITAELREAPAWNAEMTDAAQYILSELRRRSIMGEGTQEEYAQWQELVTQKGRETGRGVQANAKWSRSDNAGGRATETEAWAALQKMDLSEAERQAKFSAIVKFDMDIEAAKTPEALQSIILDIARERGVLNRVLTQKESERLTKWTESALGALDDEELKQFAYASSAAMVKDLTPANAGEMVKTVQVLNMLSSPKTTMRNLAGNTSFYALDAMTMRGAAILDMAVAKITGTRSIAMEPSVFSKESRSAIIKAVKQAIAEITLDVDMSGGNRYQKSAQRTFRASGGIAERALSAMERNMGYLLTATDEAYKGAARGTERATQQLIDQGKIKTDDKDYAKNQADALAKYRTFQGDTMPSAALQGARDFLNIVGIGDSGKRMFAGKVGKNKEGATVHSFGPGDLAAPFTRVAANLWKVGLDYSPVNAVKGAAEIVGAVVSKSSGADRATRQAKGVSGLTRGLTGTALATGFMMLAQMGLIRRAEDEGDEDVAAMNRTEGVTGTQINWSAIGRLLSGDDTSEWHEGDTLVDVSSLEPLNAIVDMGAELAKIRRGDDGGILSTYAEANYNSAIHAAQDLPVLQGVAELGKDIFSYHQDPLFAALEQLGKTAVSSATPNALAALAKGLDDKQRSTYSSEKEGLGKVGDVLLDTIKSRIPGLRETMPTSTGPDGAVKDNPGGLAERMVNAMLNPLGVNTYTQSEVSREMERVRGETGETNFYPSTTIPKKVQYTKDGKTHEATLDYDQRQAFQKVRSSTQLVTITEMMGTSQYKAADAETQAALMKLCYDYAYNRAKAGVLGEEAAPAWVGHAQDSKKDLGISQAEYLYYYEMLGGNVMSGKGYSKTCRMVKAGLTLEEWAKMQKSTDADGSGRTSDKEAEAYIRAHFPQGRWETIIKAWKGK